MGKIGKIIQWIIMILVLTLLIAHVLKWDKIQVDGTTLALVGILLVIPLIEFIRRIRIGEFEAEIGPKEVEKIKAKASDELTLLPKNIRSESELYSQIVDVVRQDPQLGLAKLRMELEKVLKALFKLFDEERKYYSPRLSYMVEKLSKEGHVPQSMASSLKDVISLANRVIHGGSVRTYVAEELAIFGVQLLEELKNFYRENAVRPIKSDTIADDEVEMLRAKKYRITTIIPLVEEPKRNVYILDQDELEDFLEGYFEYAEFIIGIEPVESKKT